MRLGESILSYGFFLAGFREHKLYPGYSYSADADHCQHSRDE